MSDQHSEDDVKVITFRKPIKLGKGDSAIEYESVTLQEPEAGEMEIARRADTDVGYVITLVHLVGKIPRKVAEKMKQSELAEASAFFESVGPSKEPKEKLDE